MVLKVTYRVKKNFLPISKEHLRNGTYTTSIRKIFRTKNIAPGIETTECATQKSFFEKHKTILIEKSVSL